MTIHEVFIQVYYPESPTGHMVGTEECPAYWVGHLNLSGNEILGMGYNIPEEYLTLLFVGKSVNIYVSGVGLLRNVEFSAKKNLLSLAKEIPPET